MTLQVQTEISPPSVPYTPWVQVPEARGGREPGPAEESETAGGVLTEAHRHAFRFTPSRTPVTDLAGWLLLALVMLLAVAFFAAVL